MLLAVSFAEHSVLHSSIMHPNALYKDRGLFLASPGASIVDSLDHINSDIGRSDYLADRLLDTLLHL